MTTTGRRAQAPLDAPAILLIEPQLPENIGATARAMMNCGLTSLRLVRPREQWPNERAREVSSGAHEPIDKAQVYPSARAAMADLTRVYATSARHRQMIKTVMTPREAAMEMRAIIARGERVGVMFGPERAGLENDELSLADAVIKVPLNPDFTSLNLAQAVLLIGYEWYQAGDASWWSMPRGPPRKRSCSTSSTISSASSTLRASCAMPRSAPEWCAISATCFSAPA
jgi:tRNA/rRNA methyltransferase